MWQEVLHGPFVAGEKWFTKNLWSIFGRKHFDEYGVENVWFWKVLILQPGCCQLLLLLLVLPLLPLLLISHTVSHQASCEWTYHRDHHHDHHDHHQSSHHDHHNWNLADGAQVSEHLAWCRFLGLSLELSLEGCILRLQLYCIKKTQKQWRKLNFKQCAEMQYQPILEDQNLCWVNTIQ